jgi:hypothetical protein
MMIRLKVYLPDNVLVEQLSNNVKQRKQTNNLNVKNVVVVVGHVDRRRTMITVLKRRKKKI